MTRAPVALLLVFGLLAACGGGSPAVSPLPISSSAPSGSPSSSQSVSVIPSPSASAAPGTNVPPGDLRCDAHSCRVERANEQTLSELARSHPDLGEIELLGGHPRTLAPLAAFTKLYRFRIALCEGLVDRDFSFAKTWNELAILDVSNCDGFTSVAPLGSLPKLADVSLVNTNLRNLDGLRGAPITKLRVQSGVTDLAAVETMTKLESLTLYDLDGIHELPFLPKLTRLTTLDVMTTDLVRVPDLSSLVALRSLTLSHCPKLTALKGLAGLPALEVLVLDWSGVTDLSAIGRSDHVTFLHLEGTKVKDLTPLSSWRSLATVIVADDTAPALVAALKLRAPKMTVKTAHQAAAAAFGPH
ncbi:hypothetical protein BH09MYX1_BH09MYX1_59130 [soil metagenome]